MVPNGWKITELGNVISHQKGFAFKSESYKANGTRIIRISDTTRNSIHDKSPVYLTDEEAAPLDNYSLREGDIILSTVGSRPHLLESMVGKAVKIRKQDHGALLNQNLVKVIPKSKLITNEYLFSMLTKNRFIYYISTLVRGNANQVSITLAELFNYKFLLPPLSEQRKIATILRTWDKAINTTERLIDNSKQQKKALMQQLLTGKKRLLDDSGMPFEGEWEEVKLENVVVKTQLGSTERTKENKDLNVVPLIKMGNLTWGGFNFNKLETVPKSIVDESLALQVGDFLFNTRNTPELVGKSAVWKGQLAEATFDNNINRISFNPSVNTDFICFYLNHGKGKAIVNSLPAGSTSVAAIYWKDLKNIKVPLPTIEEQTKIVSVLVNADKEIELLEQHLADFKQEKKALMQQLLTGKRRVKLN